MQNYTLILTGLPRKDEISDREGYMLGAKIKECLNTRGYKVEKVNLTYDLTDYN